jgi:3-hydroxy-9,10-secoandrosta-1,3,5(10)-triene-9,17-dione monooxygenase
MPAQSAAQKLNYPLPVPEPGLSPEMLVQRAIALRPAIREAQEDDDARGCHSPEMDQKFRAAGFYRILQPKMFGGYEFDYVTFYRVMLEIARGNPGVSWCLALAATHGALISSHWPERAQFELFGANGDFRSPHRVGVTTSTCQRVEGGYVVDGTWNYCSGIPYATHFVGNVLLKEDGKPPQVKIFVVARNQLTVLDDWGGEATLGMRASGSNSVKLDRVFVPDHHAIDAKPALWAAEPLDNGTPGTRLHNNPIYLGRYIAPYHMSLVVPVVGAARAAVDEFEEKVMPRPTYHPPIMPRVQHFDSQRPFGYAMTLADSAEALLLAAAEQYMQLLRRWGKDRTPFSLEDQIRIYGMVQTAGRLGSEAVEHLFHNASSFSAKKGQKLERYFRDVAMYRSHMSAQYLNIASGISRVHFGLPFGWGGL